MPLSCNGNVPSQPTGTAHIRHCRRYAQKSVWCAAHGMYSPFLLTDFHQPSALCAGTETVVLLSGLRIYCSIAYFFAAVKGFWREKTLFHDLRHPTDRDPRFFSKKCCVSLAIPPILLYNEEKPSCDFSKNRENASTFSLVSVSIRCSCRGYPLFRPNPKGAKT